MKRQYLALTLAALLTMAPAAMGAGPSWEVIRTTATAPEADTDGIYAEVRDGYIYVTAQQSVDVKVFSIVGQLISQQRLPAGTSRLKIAKRGIYILKAGDRTLRVTI